MTLVIQRLLADYVRMRDIRVMVGSGAASERLPGSRA
jgi:hypothetical protein